MNQDQYYECLTHWVTQRLRQKEFTHRPLILGLNGPQGAGKTTLARSLISRLKLEQVNALSISIDDFYLTRTEQVLVAEKSPHNPYLQQRGYPGTHDIPLGTETLDHLKSIKTLKTIQVPSYDKSKHNGKGDRLPKQEWPSVHFPIDLVILDGWMLGFRPVPSDLISDPHLRETNDQLKNYETWVRHVDTFLFLDPEDISNIIDWRIEAEDNMKKSGKPGMSSQEIRAYIDKFIPAYEIYLPQLREDLKKLPSSLRISIKKNRLPDINSEQMLYCLKKQLK